GQEIGPHRQCLRAQGNRIEGDWWRACRWRGDVQWFADVELHAEVRRVEQREERTPRVLQRQLPREEIVHELEPLDLHAAQFATRYLALLVTGSVQPDDPIDLLQRGLRNLDIGLGEDHGEVRAPDLEFQAAPLVVEAG